MRSPHDQEAAARIREAAKQALNDPTEEIAVRLQIVGVLLDPALGIVDRAVAGFEGRQRLNQLERERLQDHVTRSLERKVLGTALALNRGRPHGSRIPLQGLINSPVGWARRYASESVKGGMTVVRRIRTHTPPGSGAVPDAGQVPSAEEECLIDLDEARALSQIREVEQWDRKRMLPYEIDRAAAEQLLRYRGLPAPFVADTATRRWIESLTSTGGGRERILLSVYAARDLCERHPGRAQHVDPRLLDLWLDYTYDDLETLIEEQPDVVTTIVRGTVVFPSRPAESIRRDIRRAAKSMSTRRGWSSLVHAAEQAWAAEFFAPASERDFRGVPQTEKHRAKVAAEWPDAAGALIRFPGNPLGAGVRTIADVARWFENALEVVQREERQEAAAA